MKNQVEEPGCLRPGPCSPSTTRALARRPRGGGGPRRRRPGTPACGAAGGMPAGGAAAGGLPALPPRCPTAGRLWASLGYFLKRTQDRPESWFLNNFLRTPPLPSHSDFSSHCLTAGASGAETFSLPRRPVPAVSPLHCLPAPLPSGPASHLAHLQSAAPPRPLGDRTRPLGQRVGGEGSPHSGG